jgi:hypothetical protein
MNLFWRNFWIVCASLLLVCAPWQARASVDFTIKHKNSSYLFSYESSRSELAVTSRNVNASWTRKISGIPSLRSIAAAATPAGPVIVYDNGTNTHFSLVHWRTGGNKVDGSGESLDGVVGPGILLNCLFQVGPYGAKLVVQTLSSGSVIEHKWDVNMAGNHAMKSRSTVRKLTPGKAAQSSLLVSKPLGLSVDLPRGFRDMPGDENSVIFFGPAPDMFLTLYSEKASHAPKEIGDAYMKQLNLSVIQVTQQSLDDGTPALLYIAEGAVNGVPSKHPTIVFAAKGRVYVVTLTMPADYKTAFMFVLEEALRSLKPMG